MPDNAAKRAILRAMQRDPEFSGISALPAISSRGGISLLRWLDQSGLALGFLQSVQEGGATWRFSREWRETLEQRKKRNAARFRDMLNEFKHLNQAFHERGIVVVTLKGFSLVPDFCADACLRHQSDFDFLVDSSSVPAAAEVLQSFGYSTPRLSLTEESCFTTPLAHVPSREDDVYALQQHRQVDLHVTLWETSPWITFTEPKDCLRYSVAMNLGGVVFRSLSLADRFLSQVLHAFRHSFRSWLRLSWLREIGYCMELHGGDERLWTLVAERAGNPLLTKRIFAFVLALVHRLFGCRVPTPLHSWAAPGMTPSMHTWLDRFAISWALSDWPGNLSNLFLAQEFIRDTKLRRQYFASRLWPKRVHWSMGTTAGAKVQNSVKWNIQRCRYVAHRASAHLCDLARLPLDQLRWKHALGAAPVGLPELDS